MDKSLRAMEKKDKNGRIIKLGDKVRHYFDWGGVEEYCDYDVIEHAVNHTLGLGDLREKEYKGTFYPLAKKESSTLQII